MPISRYKLLLIKVLEWIVWRFLLQESVDDLLFCFLLGKTKRHQFDDLGIICSCYDPEQLGESILETNNKTFKPYVSNTQAIIDSIEEFLELTKKDRK